MTRLSLPYKKKLFTTRKTCYKTTFFYVQYNPYKSFNKKKFIIIISKKCGNSVQRNYIKRIARLLLIEFYALFQREYTYFIFFYKIPLKSLSYQILKNEFKKLLIISHYQ